MEEEINVNQLCTILGKHYNGTVYVTEVITTKPGTNYEKETHRVGGGNRCTLIVDIDHIKPRKRWWKRK